MQSLLYVYAGIVFLNMGMNRKVFFGYVSGVVLGIGLLLSSCGKAGGRENHSAEADSLNTLSYELRYKDLTASARAAGKAYTFAERQSEPFLGYLRAGYGNYGNLDVAGNYLFRLSAKDRLNIRLQSDGMNGKLDMPAGTEWKSKFYRLNAGVDYTHRFRSVDFDLGAGFGMSSFNYPVDGMPDQRFLSGDFRVGVGSSDEASPLQFRAETALLMFSRKHNDLAFDNDAATETQVHTKGWVGGRIDDEQYIRIGADLKRPLLRIEPEYLRRSRREKIDDLGQRQPSACDTECMQERQHLLRSWDARIDCAAVIALELLLPRE